jgi:hypothetical protein
MQEPIPPPLPIGKIPPYMNKKGDGYVQDIDLPESLNESKTSYQFIIASLCMAFDLRSSQASKLTQDNNKTLYKLCVQGAVNGDYSKIMRWY